MFLGNNWQNRPVCVKTIPSWVRKVLCVAKAHVSQGSVGGAAASAALAAVVSLGSILLAGDSASVSLSATHYFSTYITAMCKGLTLTLIHIMYACLLWNQHINHCQ